MQWCVNLANLHSCKHLIPPERMCECVHPHSTHFFGTLCEHRHTYTHTQSSLHVRAPHILMCTTQSRTNQSTTTTQHSENSTKLIHAHAHTHIDTSGNCEGVGGKRAIPKSYSTYIYM